MGKLIHHGEELTGVARKALQIIYDNTNSGLSANNAQGAIDELDGNVDKLSDINNNDLIETLTPIEITPTTGTKVRFYYYKKGVRVTIKCLLNDVTRNTQLSITTIPQGYRPREGYYAPLYRGGYIQVSSAGVMNVYTETGNVDFEISYDAFS